MPIEPPEIPPASPGNPTQPPPESPPGNPEVPPPIHEPGEPQRPDELPGRKGAKNRCVVQADGQILHLWVMVAPLEPRAILDHATSAAMVVYAHRQHDPSKRVADRVSGMISAALDGKLKAGFFLCARLSDKGESP
jgi:hypothetical protein